MRDQGVQYVPLQLQKAAQTTWPSDRSYFENLKGQSLTLREELIAAAAGFSYLQVKLLRC